MSDQEIKWRMIAATVCLVIAGVLLAVLLGGNPS